MDPIELAQSEKYFSKAIGDTKRLEFILNIELEPGNMHGTCANCGHYSTNVEIDHASTPFCEIATVFESNFPNLFPLRIIKDGYQHFIADDYTTRTWVAFHDQRADFQILCPTCNNKKKQYKKLNKLFLITTVFTFHVCSKRV